MQLDSFVVRPLTDHEKQAIREFAALDNGMPQILSLAIANEIQKVKTIDIINIDKTDEEIASDVKANKRAHDTLIDIFNELGFTLIGDKVHTCIRDRKNRPR